MDLTATSSRFEQVYRNLIVADIKRHLSSLLPAESLPEQDLAYALSVASRLALATDGGSLDAAVAARKAYDVAVRSLSFANGARRVFQEVAELILSRLGNFPARKLLLETYATEPSSLSALEILGREFENRVTHTDNSVVLTDFQVRLLRALDTMGCVSVSAPTSAGKSFTLELEISKQLRRTESYRAVYLVPTRALIRQVTYDLIRMVRGTESRAVPILSVPSPPPDEGAGGKVIYVLTQERFANLLMTAGPTLRLDALIVDEAQEIAERDRGQTLEAVIAEAITRFPTVKLFFSSPLKSNPEYLPSLFPTQRQAESFVEHVTPVSQNIINIYPITGRGNTSKARFEVWLEDESVSVGTADLPFKFRRPYVHRFAIALTHQNDSSIIYCNDPSTADKLATALSEELSETPDDSAVGALVDFLRDHIHSQYRLAHVLQKRVAFHYGNIPQIIRARIEELLRERVLQFVCCTSTLLQGMNLPAKNIFVENPKKGRGRPMSSGDFWNLVGRAGRMTKEFDGNIYCIHGVEWESEPLKAARLDPIRSAFSVALTDRITEVTETAAQPPDSSESDHSWAEQTVARVYSQFTKRDKRVAESEFATPVNRSALQSLDETLALVTQTQTLPDSILEQNLYFHPLRLEQLARRFREGDPNDWIPPNPNARGSFDQLQTCFRLLEDVFFRTGFQRYRYDAFLALRWMQGGSLKELIANKIERNNAQNDVDRINDLIRELFDDIENTLRYKYVKYMRIYTDVLKAVLLERRRPDEAERIPPIHLYLEYGASSVTLINLIAIGLSRTSAILLRHARGMRDDLSPEACQQILETIDVSSADLPAICKIEISRLRRSS